MVNTTLTDLSIGANGLGLIFAKSLSATLANNSTLQTMNIGMSFFNSNYFKSWFYSHRNIPIARRQYGVGVSMHPQHALGLGSKLGVGKLFFQIFFDLEPFNF